MNGIRYYKTIKIAGQSIKICDLSVEYVIKCQNQEIEDNIENALKDACEVQLSEVGYKVGHKLYGEIIKHTFGEATSEGSGSEKK